MRISSTKAIGYGQPTPFPAAAQTAQTERGVLHYPLMVLLYIVAARYLTLVLAVWLAAELVRGVEVASQATLWTVAFLLGLFNLTIKPILFLLTLPLTIATYGLFALVLNAALLWFIASFTEGFTITHFFAAVLASLIISLVSTASWWFLQWWGKRTALQSLEKWHRWM